MGANQSESRETQMKRNGLLMTRARETTRIGEDFEGTITEGSGSEKRLESSECVMYSRTLFLCGTRIYRERK